jgi:hypothetical protein
MDLHIFSQPEFLPALKALFENLKVPVDYVADEPTTKKEILAAKTANPVAKTTAIERRINDLLYKLYDLTYKQVKLIGREFGLSMAEYEVLK